MFACVSLIHLYSLPHILIHQHHLHTQGKQLQKCKPHSLLPNKKKCQSFTRIILSLSSYSCLSFTRIMITRFNSHSIFILPFMSWECVCGNKSSSYFVIGILTSSVLNGQSVAIGTYSFNLHTDPFGIHPIKYPPIL